MLTIFVMVAYVILSLPGLVSPRTLSTSLIIITPHIPVSLKSKLSIYLPRKNIVNKQAAASIC